MADALGRLALVAAFLSHNANVIYLRVIESVSESDMDDYTLAIRDDDNSLIFEIAGVLANPNYEPADVPVILERDHGIPRAVGKFLNDTVTRSVFPDEMPTG